MPTDVTAAQRTESVYITDSSGNTVSVTSNRLVVDGSGVTQPVSGTVSITANSSVNLAQVGGTNVVTGGVAGSQGVGGLAAAGSAIAGNPVLLGGSDSGTMRALSVDSTGKLNVNASAAAASDTTSSGTVGSLNATVSVAMAGQQTAQFSLPSGNNLVATLTFQASFDGGTTYSTNGVQWRTLFSSIGTLNNGSTTSAVSSAQEWFQVNVPQGASHARVIATAYTSGTVTASARAVADLGFQTVAGIVAQGSSGANIYPIVDGGLDSSNNVRALSTDSSGRLNTILGLPTVAGTSRASISFAASGDNTVIAGIAAKTIRIHKIFFVLSGDANLTFKDGTGGTALSGAMDLYQGAAFVLPTDTDPWFVTSTANAFVINLSAAVQLSGVVYYTQS